MTESERDRCVKKKRKKNDHKAMEEIEARGSHLCHSRPWLTETKSPKSRPRTLNLVRMLDYVIVSVCFLTRVLAPAQGTVEACDNHDRLAIGGLMEERSV